MDFCAVTLISCSSLCHFLVHLIFNNPGNNDTSSQQYKVLASLASDHSLLKALLHGGPARIYHCDNTETEGCLNPTLTNHNDFIHYRHWVRR